MEEQSKNPNPESENPRAAVDTSLYKTRFEEIVMDAQYMIIHASANRKTEIKRKTMESLSRAKLRVENQQKFSPEDEAEFWSAYHELCELIKPVTVESIKANLPVKRTSTGGLFEEIPGLSGWLEKMTISKSRKTLFWYVSFTILVLLLVLFFQIYWVVGNQLSTQVNDLAQAERELSVQINENSTQGSVLGTQLNQDSTQAQLTGLEKKKQSLETQLVQTLVVFLNWSSPWNKLINKGELKHSGEYDSQLDGINTQIAELDRQDSVDPDGMLEAANNETVLAAQIAAAINKDDSQKKLNLVNNKNALESILTSLNQNELGIQGQMEEQINEKNDLENQIADLDNAKSDIQKELTTLKDNLKNAQPALTPEAPPPAKPDETPTSTPPPDIYQPQIDYIDNLLSANPDFNEEAPPSENNFLADQATQLGSIAARRGYLHEQLKSINDQLNPIDANKVDDLRTTLTSLLDDPETNQNSIYALIVSTDSLPAQLSEIDAIQQAVQAQMDKLQADIDIIPINTENSPEIVALQQSVAAQIKSQRTQNRQDLINQRNTLQSQALAKSIRDDAGPAQLEGRFALDILQSYLLPLLYGILGAATFVVRSLVRQIRNVTYSESSGNQYISHISLGALAGILVGWFSFLLPSENFVGSVSPMAIAFLVGYNIELVFSKMDEFVVTRIREIRQRTSPVVENESQKAASTTNPPGQPAQETSSKEGSDIEEPKQ